jgi:hypothetical protein
LPIVNIQVLCMLRFAHFSSHVSYGIVFWGSPTSMRNVFIIQKRAIKITLRLRLRGSCREVLKKYLKFLVYIFMPWCYLLSKILIFIKLTLLFWVRTQGSKINCTYPCFDFPHYREMSTIHLLIYLTSYHKIYSDIVTTYITLWLC